VRDAFLAAHDAAYQEVEIWCRRDEDGWHATGTLERGFDVAAARHGDRYVSGIRGEESAGRARRVRAYGLSTGRTCAPVGRWSSALVYAYLAHHDLPVHPAYACTHGGSLDRGRLRVASLGGQRGTGRGREEWERRYYREELARLEGR
jgi:phosphoadenosine phosphosulfate reductase